MIAEIRKREETMKLETMWMTESEAICVLFCCLVGFLR